MIPDDIWRLIAEHTDVNPFIYTSWAHVCRASRLVFFTDARWRKFTPLGCKIQLALQFHSRVSAMAPEQCRIFKLLWSLMEELMHYQESEATMLRIIAYKPQITDFTLRFKDDRDIALVSLYYHHTTMPIWGSPLQPRALLELCCDRDFMMCALRLFPAFIYASADLLEELRNSQDRSVPAEASGSRRISWPVEPI